VNNHNYNPLINNQSYTDDGVNHNSYNSMNQKLMGSAAIAIILYYWLVNPYNKPLATLLLATGIFLLGLYPLWIWLGQREPEVIPVLQFHGVFYAICFGISGFVNPQYKFSMFVNEAQLQDALIAALVGLVSIYVSYFIIAPKIVPYTHKFKWPFLFKESAYGDITLILYPVFLAVKLFVMESNLSIFFQPINFICNFLFMALLHAYWSNLLPKAASKVFMLLILPFNMIILSGFLDSHIAGFVTFCVWISITIKATQCTIPYKWALLAVAIFLLLQPIKGQYREVIWYKGRNMSFEDKLKTAWTIGGDYYFGNTALDKHIDSVETTFQRVNHLHVTAAVIADTPSSIPFLYGQTYLPLFTKWIPRLLWPEKPIEDLGNRWARKYGYLNFDDYQTSFNLPWLTEMYINFGMAGIIMISLLIGLLFRFLSEMLWRYPTDSSGFALGLITGSPLMFVESHLSMVLGGLIICLMVLFTTMKVLVYLTPQWIKWNA
jgi:hypothetical protein